MSYRVRAVLEYDGTDYAGFQRQPNCRTVQGEVEAVLRRLTRTEVRVLSAGRTDAGVHAEGQVIAFDTDWRHPLSDLGRGLNALLPRSIVAKRLDIVAPDFHPRFDAKSRLYRYRILNQSTRSPLHERYAIHVPRALDVEAMDRATQSLIGTHDFGTFGQPTQGDSTIREVLDIAWHRCDRLIWMDIEANAFLRNMVRCIMGTTLQVGLGEIGLEQFVKRFHARDRSQSAPPASPQGLCLVAVRYEECASTRVEVKHLKE